MSPRPLRLVTLAAALLASAPGVAGAQSSPTSTTQPSPLPLSLTLLGLVSQLPLRPWITPVRGMAATRTGWVWTIATMGIVESHITHGTTVVREHVAVGGLPHPFRAVATTGDGTAFFLLDGTGDVVRYAARSQEGTATWYVGRAAVGITTALGRRGFYTFTSGGVVTAEDGAAPLPEPASPPRQPVVAMALNQAGPGYWLGTRDGVILPEDGAPAGTFWLRGPHTRLTSLTTPLSGPGYYSTVTDGVFTPATGTRFVACAKWGMRESVAMERAPDGKTAAVVGIAPLPGNRVVLANSAGRIRVVRLPQGC